MAATPDVVGTARLEVVKQGGNTTLGMDTNRATRTIRDFQHAQGCMWRLETMHVDTGKSDLEACPTVSK